MPTIQQIKQWVPLVNQPWINSCIDDDTKILSVEELLMDTAPKENYIILGTMFDICHANRDRDADTVNKNGHPTSKKIKKSLTAFTNLATLMEPLSALSASLKPRARQHLPSGRGFALGKVSCCLSLSK
jgi:hypothetical protein